MVLRNIMDDIVGDIISPTLGDCTILPVLPNLTYRNAAFDCSLGKAKLVTVDGSDLVSKWKGIDGTVLDGDQAIETNRPQYIANGINGLPSINFDGVDNFFDINYPVPDELTLFIVCKVSEINDSYLISADGTGSSPAIISNFASQSFEWFFDSERFTINTSGTGNNIITIVRKNSGGVLKAYFNGQLVFNNVSSVDATGLIFKTIGRAGGGSNQYKGNIGEIIGYNSLLSDSERVSIENGYLSPKWKVTVFSILSQNPLFYFDGDNIDSLPVVNPVEDIFDSSPNSNDLEQTTINQKPALDTSGEFRGVKFDGVDDVLERSDSLGLTGSPDLTIFVVVGFDALDADQESIFQLGGPDAGERFTLIKNSGALSHKVSVAFGNGSVTFDTVIGASTQLITINRPASTNHNSTRIWKNGVEGTRETSSTNNLSLSDTGVFLGAQDSTGANSITNGIIYSYTIFDKTFSDAKRQQLENSFITKYGT